jgi:hypothetical protein
VSVTNLLAQSATPDNSAEEAAARGAAACLSCSTGVIVLDEVNIILAIALIVWVARDSKNRGMDNSFIWTILVFFTESSGVYHLHFFAFSRQACGVSELQE